MAEGAEAGGPDAVKAKIEGVTAEGSEAGGADAAKAKMEVDATLKGAPQAGGDVAAEKVVSGRDVAVGENGAASKKRDAHAAGGEDGEQAAAKRPKRAEGPKRTDVVVAGLQKCLIKGLTGIKQDALQGNIDRLGIPNSRLWKQRQSDTAEVWLPDDPVFLKGAAFVINGSKVHGRVMSLEIAPDSSDGAKAGEVQAEAPPARVLQDQVAPLHRMPYDEQVHFKALCLKGSLKNLTKRLLTEVTKECGGVKLPWLKEVGKGPAVELDTFHPSPVQEGYRNKNEFTIGYDHEKKPCVGFRFGRYSDGDVSIGCADGCKNIPEVALLAARTLQTFLRDHQDLECWGPEKHTGVWRLLLVRHNEAGGALIMVQYSSRNCKEKEQADKLEAALVKLKTFIVDEATRTGLKIASLFVQEHNEVGNRALDSTPVQLVHGDAVFHEKLLGLSFRISPTAFFQVNTKAAEVLNCLIRDWAGADKDGIVLDVCCGTGTIGLCISQGARKVVGIEMCEAAVQDAKLNASSNNVSNCDFLAGKAEDQITKVIAEYVTPGTFTHCVAVLDPPREGVHNKVLKALREAPAIERIVYVSCNHVAWVEQAKMLCSPSTKIGGEPFTPVRANGVDLFPHTPHVELICLFERGACLAKSRPPKPEPETAAPAATKPEADAPSAVKAEEASAVA